jgi:antagonist of KipI
MALATVDRATTSVPSSPEASAYGSGKIKFSSAHMLSAPTAIGTIQLPPSGEPIVLMADSATTGGYPRIGHIAHVDLPRLAQRKPGSIVQLEPISLDQSYQLLDDRQQTWRRLVFGSQC